ncbi:MAG: helix-turn-helix domain-containing protein [Myxococcota bacterium]
MEDTRAPILYQGFPMLGRGRAQIWAYAPEFRRPRHFHAEHELNLVVAGAAWFGVGEAVVEVKAGELLAFAPGQDHVLLRASKDLLLFATGIDAALVGEVLGHARHRAWLPLHIRPQREEWQVLVRRVSDAAGRESSQSAAELCERVYLARGGDAACARAATHVFTRRTLEIICEAPDLGRSEVARLARANESEISRFFHRDFGVRWVEYRTRLRLMRFMRLVDQRATNLTAAAIGSGFGSYSQFHRSFQASFSCAPREFFTTGLRERMEQAFEPFNRSMPAPPSAR